MVLVGRELRTTSVDVEDATDRAELVGAHVIGLVLRTRGRRSLRRGGRNTSSTPDLPAITATAAPAAPKLPAVPEEERPSPADDADGDSATVGYSHPGANGSGSSPTSGA
jgi:hypothetical protein